MLLLFLLLLLLYLHLANANERCIKLLPYVYEATVEVLGVDYPYWYNAGLLETESNCKWVKSLDGFGSIGYAQITKSQWDRVLRPIYPYWDRPNSKQYFYATAFVIKKSIENTCRLWQGYQVYNGGRLVVKECKVANSCRWEECRKQCKRQNVCVYMTASGCRQYRNACDINYAYSVKVYRNGQKYRAGEDKIPYW